MHLFKRLQQLITYSEIPPINQKTPEKNHPTIFQLLLINGCNNVNEYVGNNVNEYASNNVNEYVSNNYYNTVKVNKN